MQSARLMYCFICKVGGMQGVARACTPRESSFWQRPARALEFLISSDKYAKIWVRFATLKLCNTLTLNSRQYQESSVIKIRGHCDESNVTSRVIKPHPCRPLTRESEYLLRSLKIAFILDGKILGLARCTITSSEPSAMEAPPTVVSTTTACRTLHTKQWIIRNMCEVSVLFSALYATCPYYVVRYMQILLLFRIV